MSNVGSYKRNAWYNLGCLLQAYDHLSTNKKLSISRQFFQTYGVISYSSGWTKDGVNQCLEFGSLLERICVGYLHLQVRGTPLKAMLLRHSGGWSGWVGTRVGGDVGALGRIPRKHIGVGTQGSILGCLINGWVGTQGRILGCGGWGPKEGYWGVDPRKHIGVGTQGSILGCLINGWVGTQGRILGCGPKEAYWGGDPRKQTGVFN